MRVQALGWLVVLVAGGCTAEGFMFASASVARSSAIPGIEQVLISQIYVNSDATGTVAETDEFIELFNPGSTEVVLSGWILSDNVGDYLFPNGTVIPPGGFLIISTKTASTFADSFGSEPDLIWGSSGLGNESDSVVLTDGSGNTIDAVVWGTDQSVPGWTGTTLPGFIDLEPCAFRRGNPGRQGTEANGELSEDLLTGFFAGPEGDYCSIPDPRNLCGPKGAVCGELDACTTSSTCNESGFCLGATIICAPDSNPCTVASCDRLIGCFMDPVAGPCEDGDACTENDTCVQGTCEAGTARACPSSDPCVEHACDSKVGCVPSFTSNDCSDGAECTTDDACADGICVGTPYLCEDDGNACTAELCDGVGGCERAPVSGPGCCQQNSDCEVPSSCITGECKESEHRCELSNLAGCCTEAEQCDDGNPCTVDDCERGTGTCVSAPVIGCCRFATDCDDADPCTTDECTSGNRCLRTSLSCDDTSPCADNYFCSFSALRVSAGESRSPMITAPAVMTVMRLEFINEAVQAMVDHLSLTLHASDGTAAPASILFSLHADANGDGIADRERLAGPVAMGEDGKVHFEAVGQLLEPYQRVPLFVKADVREPAAGGLGSTTWLSWLFVALSLVVVGTLRRRLRIVAAVALCTAVAACSFERISIDQRWQASLSLAHSEDLGLVTDASQRVDVQGLPVSGQPFTIVY